VQRQVLQQVRLGGEPRVAVLAHERPRLRVRRHVLQTIPKINNTSKFLQPIIFIFIAKLEQINGFENQKKL